MKLKIPARKKNKEDTRDSGVVFDLTDSMSGRKAEKEMLSASDSFGLTDSDKDAFEVSVRNAEPIIRRLDTEKEHAAWLGNLQLNLASAGIVMALLCLLFMAADVPDLVFFAFPGFVVFMLIATLDSFDDDKVKRFRLIAAAIIAAALIAALIVFRKYIGNGWALIMDHLYDTAEMAQAYIYNRFHVGALGNEHPHRCMHAAAVWGSCLLGLVTAAPPARFRRTVAIIAACFAMLAFAYYGIIPSWACIAVLAAAIVFLMARGSLISSLTVLLAAVLVFCAVTIIDPGESYGISRADENFRDRFALISSYLDVSSNSLNDLDQLEQQMQDEQEQEENGGAGFITEHRGLVGIVILLLVLVALGTAAGFMIRRVRMRQAENRAGLDASDPKKAITAMFPYAVKWLQPAGIEPMGKPFFSLIPVIRADVSDQYADRYENMYFLWEEAAYSDHEMTEEKRSEMDSFLKDTMEMIREKSDLRMRIINTVKYAL